VLSPTSKSQASQMGRAQISVNAQYVVHFTIFALLPMLNDVIGSPSSSSIYQQPIVVAQGQLAHCVTWLDPINDGEMV